MCSSSFRQARNPPPFALAACMELLELQRVLIQQYQQEVQEMCEGLNREAGLIHRIARVDGSNNDCSSSGSSGGGGSGGGGLVVDPATAMCRQLLEIQQVTCGLRREAGAGGEGEDDAGLMQELKAERSGKLWG